MIKIKKHDRRACCSAFLLFVFTGVLTLSVLVGALFGNPARMVRSLGGDTYVDGLYTEVHQYAADLCLEYGLDTAVADAVPNIEKPRTACARRCRPMRGLC